MLTIVQRNAIQVLKQTPKEYVRLVRKTNVLSHVKEESSSKKEHVFNNAVAATLNKKISASGAIPHVKRVPAI